MNMKNYDAPQYAPVNFFMGVVFFISFYTTKCSFCTIIPSHRLILSSFKNESENPDNTSFAPSERASAQKGISPLSIPAFMWLKRAYESGQRGHMRVVKMVTSYIDAEITTENTTEKGIQEKPQSDQKGNQENFELVFQIWSLTMECER